MGLIKRRVAFLSAALFLMCSGLVSAQNAGQLGTEIKILEQRLSAGISSAERYSVLVSLAHLRQLSGNIAGAAVNWLEAAQANPNDDAALITGAYCLTAIGEWEKAALALRPLLVPGKRGLSVLQACYLDACLRAWSSSGGGDASALVTLAVSSDFITLRPLIYYTLWRTVTGNPGIRGGGSAEQWKSRLLAEFPKSPEARVVSTENAGASFSVSAVQSPLWLFLPGSVGSAFTEPARPAPPSVAPPAVSAPPAAASVALQTGLFSRETNANTQSEALRKAGFPATVSRKLVNDVEYWAVTVPAGQDSKKTTQDLKNAGFDSFPVK
jgi:cell division septation protein DedD